ncbi:MAG TPA: copper resistance protein CopC [Acidimicrobiales bacterium]
MPARAVAAAVTALALALLAVAGAPPAGAHATLIDTVPAADATVDGVPDAVELRFDEPVEVLDDAIEVFGPGGERVDGGAVEVADGGATLRAPIDADDEGTYTVAWRVTSEDSHALTGSFVFHNGTQTGGVAVGDGGGDTATSLAGWVGRWLALAGLLTAAGSAALALLAGNPGRRRPVPALAGDGSSGDGSSGDGSSADGSSGDVAAWPGRGGEAAGAGGAAGLGGGHPAEHAGHDLIAPGAGAGAPAATVPMAGGRAATLAPPAPAHHAQPAPAPGAAMARPRHLAVAGALAAAAGAAIALVAAVAESAGRSLGGAATLVADVAPDTRTGQLALARIALCLLAASAAGRAGLWRRSPLAALVPLAAALFTLSLAGHAWTAPDRWLAIASDAVHLGAAAVWAGGLLPLLLVLPRLDAAGRRRLATRFSALALGAVGAVAVSGTVSGWQQVRALEALTSTTYGRLLLAKVAGLALLVALGWVNRARFVPIVERAAAPLRTALRAEVAIAAVVLAVTAALVHEPPARTAATSGPYDTIATAEGGEVVSATVDPATAGTNAIHLYFRAGEGGEPLPVDAVEVTAGRDGVPPRGLQVTPVTADHVTVPGASLPSAGTWTIEVTAVRAGEALVFTFEVPIS